MQKNSASALRSAVTIQDTIANGIRNWRMMFRGRDIGGAFARPIPGGSGWQLGDIRLDRQFQNMGLGKKLYGGILSSLAPGQRLLSGDQVSPGAQSVWQSLMSRQGKAPWAIQPGGFSGAAPQTGVPPVGDLHGLYFPNQAWTAAKALVPHNVTPYHYQAIRTPTPLRQAAQAFIKKI